MARGAGRFSSIIYEAVIIKYTTQEENPGMLGGGDVVMAAECASHSHAAALFIRIWLGKPFWDMSFSD